MTNSRYWPPEVPMNNPRVVAAPKIAPAAPQNAMEPHYSLEEIAKAWGISVRIARRIFRDVPGVSDVCSRRVLTTRPYTILRIPASVAARVHAQRDTGFVLGAKRRK
jgi:hypothetical protein